MVSWEVLDSISLWSHIAVDTTHFAGSELPLNRVHPVSLLKYFWRNLHHQEFSCLPQICLGAAWPQDQLLSPIQRPPLWPWNTSLQLPVTSAAPSLTPHPTNRQRPFPWLPIVIADTRLKFPTIRLKVLRLTVKKHNIDTGDTTAIRRCQNNLIWGPLRWVFSLLQPLKERSVSHICTPFVPVKNPYTHRSLDLPQSYPSRLLCLYARHLHLDCLPVLPPNSGYLLWHLFNSRAPSKAFRKWRCLCRK